MQLTNLHLWTNEHLHWIIWSKLIKCALVCLNEGLSVIYVKFYDEGRRSNLNLNKYTLYQDVGRHACSFRFIVFCHKHPRNRPPFLRAKYEHFICKKLHFKSPLGFKPELSRWQTKAMPLNQHYPST